MLMFSEEQARATARRLEIKLLEAMNGSDDVKEFAKKHLYFWYLSECNDGWVSVNEEIKEFFK